MTRDISETNFARDFPLALFTDIEFELATREWIMHLTNGLVGSYRFVTYVHFKVAFDVVCLTTYLLSRGSITIFSSREDLYEEV